MKAFPLALVSLALLAPAAEARQASCTGADAVVTEATRIDASRTIRCLITAERAAHGQRRLRPHKGLRLAAERFATTLVQRGEFDHVIDGVPSLGGRLRAAGYRSFRVAGENLAWAGDDLATPRTIVEGWMGSSGHRANLLNPRFREVGIGIAMSTPEGGEGITVASEFASRR